MESRCRRPCCEVLRGAQEERIQRIQAQRLERGGISWHGLVAVSRQREEKRGKAKGASSDQSVYQLERFLRHGDHWARNAEYGKVVSGFENNSSRISATDIHQPLPDNQSALPTVFTEAQADGGGPTGQERASVFIEYYPN